MDIHLDHPVTLRAFEAASPVRVRRWVWIGLGLWLVLVCGDWAARFGMFRWQDQWMIDSAAPGGSAVVQATAWTVPARTGAGLTQMVPVRRIAARYAEEHPEYTEYRDAFGYCNAPRPEGTRYPVVMLGDSFMLSLGTQNLAQVLATVGGIEVYNHAMRGAGPFLEMRNFIRSERFDPPPRVVVWNLSARELGAPLFLRQSVDAWFDQAAPGAGGAGLDRSGIRWDLLAPSVLRKIWPSTSLTAYLGRQAWAWVKLGVFQGWPQDVLGADDPRFGPMLFYRENLRVLPLLVPEGNAPAVVQTVEKAARRFRERGMTLVVLLVPEKEQIHAAALSPADQAALACGPGLLEAIEQGLKSGGVPVVNLMPVFQEATARGERLYWRDDTHWNDAGIHVAAEALWRVTGPLLK